MSSVTNKVCIAYNIYVYPVSTYLLWIWAPNRENFPEKLYFPAFTNWLCHGDGVIKKYGIVHFVHLTCVKEERTPSYISCKHYNLEHWHCCLFITYAFCICLIGWGHECVTISYNLLVGCYYYTTVKTSSTVKWPVLIHR